MLALETPARDTSPQNGAGLCVACGLCLPHCPTYRIALSEAESPRGRIALMRGLATGELAPDRGLTDHLDHCLGCRACERICPSAVPYGQLIDTARAQLAGNRRRRPARSALRAITLFALVHRRARRLLGLLLRLHVATGLQKLLRARWLPGRGALARIDATLDRPPRTARWNEVYPSTGPTPRGQLALFTGCATDLFEGEVLADGVRVLNRLGYTVHVPPTQTCCGALHWHGGRRAQAGRLMSANVTAFDDPRCEAIVSCASGCSAMLAEYGRCLPGGEVLATRTRDISRFLDTREWPSSMKIRPLAARIAVHDACLLRNALRGEQAPYRLLRRIPGATVVPLADNHICCGAGGTHFLDHPEIANALRAEKIRHVRALAPDFLVTTNTGCALHLRAGLRDAGLNIEVLHPVTLLARQLEAST
jgi:glycolate oxidase iron-sulfur subunit